MYVAAGTSKNSNSPRSFVTTNDVIKSQFILPSVSLTLQRARYRSTIGVSSVQGSNFPEMAGGMGVGVDVVWVFG